MPCRIHLDISQLSPFIFSILIYIFLKAYVLIWLLCWSSGKEPACQCRRHTFDPRTGEIPYATKQLSPWATMIEPALWSLGTAATEAHGPSGHTLQHEKSSRWEGWAQQWRVAPHSLQLENSLQQWSLITTKDRVNTIIFLKFK